MATVQVTSLRRMFHSVTQEVRLGLKFGGDRKCVVCSTARAEVAFVPFREGVESSGNKSGAHGRLSREVVSGRGVGRQRRSRNGGKGGLWARGLDGRRQGPCWTTREAGLEPGTPILCARRLSWRRPGAGGPDTGHCPLEGCGPPLADEDSRVSEDTNTPRLGVRMPPPQWDPPAPPACTSRRSGARPPPGR